MKSPAQFLEELLKNIVNSPSEVKVVHNDLVLEVKAAGSDLGIIIGKNGKNIRAFRSVVNLKTAKEGTPRLDIKINEEEKTSDH